MIRRRAFIAGLVAAWPVVARAQQERVRRIGALMGWAETDPQSQAFFAAFRQKLATLGWTEGSNLRIDLRWTAREINRTAFLAKELVSLQPDVLVASTTPVTAAIQHET